MFAMNKVTLGTIALGTAIGLATAAQATSQTMTFEGLQDNELIQSYYNGGTGSLGSGSGPEFWSCLSAATSLPSFRLLRAAVGTSATIRRVTR